MQMVIATYGDPPLPLARLRARSDILEQLYRLSK
jgi:hypothetical protein